MLDFDSLYQKVGERIRSIRERQEDRMSQQALAEILKLKRTSITNIELGRQKLTLEAVYLFCDRFGLEIHELLPSLKEVRTPDQLSVVIGGQSHPMGARTASAVERLRPVQRRRR